jgi:hypothetical protein
MTSGRQPLDGRDGHRSTLEIPPGLCRRCVRALSRRLRDLPGVVAFEIDAQAGRVWLSGEVERGDAEAAVRDLSCS